MNPGESTVSSSSISKWLAEEKKPMGPVIDLKYICQNEQCQPDQIG